MPIHRPFRRTCRQFTDESYSNSGNSLYILHENYAESPEHYIRAFLILLKDLQELFDFIEPADTNSSTYSHRIYELLLRACTEVEANCKAILNENGYRRNSMNMTHYRKINFTHRLSSYEVKLPFWSGVDFLRIPFASWERSPSLDWYQAYNRAKHNRHNSFELATFNHLINAVSGLIVLLSAQFYTYDFGPTDWSLSVGGPHNDGMEAAIGGYFRVRFPRDWPEDQQYDFEWRDLRDEDNPFDLIDYNLID